MPRRPGDAGSDLQADRVARPPIGGRRAGSNDSRRAADRPLGTHRRSRGASPARRAASTQLGSPGRLRGRRPRRAADRRHRRPAFGDQGDRRQRQGDGTPARPSQGATDATSARALAANRTTVAARASSPTHDSSRSTLHKNGDSSVAPACAMPESGTRAAIRSSPAATAAFSHRYGKLRFAARQKPRKSSGRQ